MKALSTVFLLFTMSALKSMVSDNSRLSITSVQEANGDIIPLFMHNYLYKKIEMLRNSLNEKDPNSGDYVITSLYELCINNQDILLKNSSNINSREILRSNRLIHSIKNDKGEKKYIPKKYVSGVSSTIFTQKIEQIKVFTQSIEYGLLPAFFQEKTESLCLAQEEEERIPLYSAKNIRNTLYALHMAGNQKHPYYGDFIIYELAQKCKDEQWSISNTHLFEEEPTIRHLLHKYCLIHSCKRKYRVRSFVNAVMQSLLKGTLATIIHIPFNTAAMVNEVIGNEKYFQNYLVYQQSEDCSADNKKGKKYKYSPMSEIS